MSIKRQLKKNCQSFILNIQNYGPNPKSYFNRVKIISLIKMMCQKLGWQPSWDFQKVDKILARQDKNDLDDQNLLLATVQ
jgi:hypothetical protein